MYQKVFRKQKKLIYVVLNLSRNSQIRCLWLEWVELKIDFSGSIAILSSICIIDLSVEHVFWRLSKSVQGLVKVDIIH